MKTRIFAFVLTLLMMFSVFPFGVFATDGGAENGDTVVNEEQNQASTVQEDGSWEYVSYGDGIALTKYLGSQTDVYVPSKLGDYAVIKLADGIFENNDTINSVTLGNGILEIGERAFYDCDNLVCILLSEELTTIGADAFNSCDIFNSIILYDGIDSIGENAFADCPELLTYCYTDSYAYTYVSQNGVNFKLLDSTEAPTIVTHNYLLYHISNGEATLMGPAGSFTGEGPIFVIPAYIEGVPVTKISNSAFKNKWFYPIGSKYSSSWSMRLPNTIKYIGEYAFYSTSLQEINIPDGITTLENGVFSSTYLYRIEFGENVKRIGNDAFSGSNISELPDLRNVEYIGDYAFSNTRISELPDLSKVSHIGSYAFAQTQLVSAVYPSFVPEVGEGLFYGCANLEVAYIEYFDDILPACTFDDCASLKRAYVSEYQWFWEDAFSGSPNLILHIYDDCDGEYIQNFETPKPYYFVTSLEEEAPIVELDGIRYFVNDVIGEVTLLCCYEQWWQYYIPEEIDGYPVTTINTRAFYRSGASEIYLPSTIRNIGKEAFAMSNLSYINIPEGVSYLPRMTFYDCENLKSIEFPESMQTIGSYAFAYSGLETLQDFKNVETIEYFAFAYCDKLVELTYPISASVEQGAFCDCDSLKYLTIPEGVETLGYSVLADNNALEVVIIPKSVTTIRDSAIYGRNLVLGVYPGSCAEQYAIDNDIPYFDAEVESNIEIVVENSVKYFIINGEAQVACGDGYTIKIPAYVNGYPVTIIRDNAFAESSVVSVTLPETIKIIGNRAFYWTSLRSINFPEGLERIGNSAFFWTDLSNVTLPDSLVYIGSAAFTFSNISKIPNLTNVKEIHYYTFGNTDIYGTIVLEAEKTYGGSVFTGTNITKVIVERGVTTIPSSMFADCAALTTVIIPSSVTEIATNAFEGCGKVILHVFEGSYAHRYAIENDIEYFLLRYEENPEIAYGTSIEGVVTNSDGTAASGVTVEIYYEDGTLKESVVTDANGKYTFTYAEVGSYVIKAYNSNGNTAATRVNVKRMNVFDVFLSGDTAITLKAGYNVSGTVNADNATVKLTDANGNIISTVNTENGVFNFTNVVNGTYLLVAETENGATNKEITVYNGDVTSISLEIDTNVAGIFGYVEVADRKGKTEKRGWVTVSVYDELGAVISTTKSGNDGSYSFDNLPFGDYFVVATVSEMRSDKKHGYERQYELYGYGYISITATGTYELDTITLYEKNDCTATVSGKANINKDKSKSCEFIMYNAFGVEYARVSSENGKYSFKNVEDGLYIVMALTENDGMGYEVITVLNGKVKGNTNINVTKAEKIEKQEGKFMNEVPEAESREQAEVYRERIAAEKRFYDGLSEKEKKQLSKRYIQMLNRYIEYLVNCESNEGVENGGLVVSADELLNGDEISFTITVNKQDKWVDNANGVETEKDFINHNMKDKAGKSEIVEYYEITMTKTANGFDKAIRSVYKDTDAMGKFRVTLEIPEEYRGQKHYSLVHVHCGEVTVLTDLDDNPDTITVEIDKFSTFALATTNEELYDEAESTVALDDIITFKGYSVGPNGTSICAGFDIDYEALDIYEAKTGETVDFGVVFTSFERLNGDNPLVSATGEVITSTAVLKTSLKQYEYNSYELILTDITEDIASHKFTITAYIYNGICTVYAQDDALAENVIGHSLNEIKEMTK